MDFTDKVVIVTGGASGIGQATAREFAARHAAVAIFDRNGQAGAETAAALRGASVMCPDSAAAARTLVTAWVRPRSEIEIFAAAAGSMGAPRFSRITATLA